MDRVDRHRPVSPGRPAPPRRSTADFLKVAAVLAASVAQALLVAAAGNALPDQLTVAAAGVVAPADPRLNVLEFCSGEVTQRRCTTEPS
jgi:hypothetical protein